MGPATTDQCNKRVSPQLLCCSRSVYRLLICPRKEKVKQIPRRRSGPELAFITEIEEAEEQAGQRNREVVLQLYEALERRDAERVKALLAPDLDWWFHGPRTHQHLKRLLTGDSEDDGFCFLIHSVDAFGPTVVAEGHDINGTVFWVHAWTVSDGVITQVREYFNTSLIVTRVAPADARCLPLWQSRLSSTAGRSHPAIVLAI